MRIVVDTSAIVAILFGEPERERFLAMIDAHEPAISVGSAIELMRVVLRREPQWRNEARDLLDTCAIELVSVDERQLDLAEDGMMRFGKGRSRPPAVLNFGDLFAYALARHLDAPLLFKGNDFAQTDVRVALAG